jgi:hypothetical protein
MPAPEPPAAVVLEPEALELVTLAPVAVAPLPDCPCADSSAFMMPGLDHQLALLPPLAELADAALPDVEELEAEEPEVEEPEVEALDAAAAPMSNRLCPAFAPLAAPRPWETEKLCCIDDSVSSTLDAAPASNNMTPNPAPAASNLDAARRSGFTPARFACSQFSKRRAAPCEGNSLMNSI